MIKMIAFDESVKSAEFLSDFLVYRPLFFGDFIFLEFLTYAYL